MLETRTKLKTEGLSKDARLNKLRRFRVERVLAVFLLTFLLFKSLKVGPFKG